MQRTIFLIEKKEKDITFVPLTLNSVAKKRINSRMTYLPERGRTSPLSPLVWCMPTLSFSFSTKAHGVNRDIFSQDDCCLEPKYLDAAASEEDHISPMLDETAAIWLDLKECIPKVQREAQNTAIAIRQSLGEIE